MLKFKHKSKQMFFFQAEAYLQCRDGAMEGKCFLLPFLLHGKGFLLPFLLHGQGFILPFLLHGKGFILPFLLHGKGFILPFLLHGKGFILPFLLHGKGFSSIFPVLKAFPNAKESYFPAPMGKKKWSHFDPKS